MIIGALHSRPAQTVGELVITSSVSRATVYRTLHRLVSHGLVHHVGEIWILAPRRLGRLLGALTEAEVVPSRGWDEIASHHGTAGLSSSRKTYHAAERAMYRAALGRLAEHRSTAHVIVRDGRQVLIPAPRPDDG
ncbi:helix-turn-helix domain-containing protein [Streptomyces sp. NPDC002588]|uniref:helix-turn-helix domain-containing protein n=1 Tax=Streptomyces sp. NPDC002588 TaxID=3154419 RepID=UPI003334A532